jgi:hypothetical protein
MSVCYGLQVIVQPWKINEPVRPFFQFKPLCIKEVQKNFMGDEALKRAYKCLVTTDIERPTLFMQ